MSEPSRTADVAPGFLAPVSRALPSPIQGGEISRFIEVVNTARSLLEDQTTGPLLRHLGLTLGDEPTANATPSRMRDTDPLICPKCNRASTAGAYRKHNHLAN